MPICQAAQRALVSHWGISQRDISQHWHLTTWCSMLSVTLISATFLPAIFPFSVVGHQFYRMRQARGSTGGQRNGMVISHHKVMFRQVMFRQVMLRLAMLGHGVAIPTGSAGRWGYRHGGLVDDPPVTVNLTINVLGTISLRAASLPHSIKLIPGTGKRGYGW